MSATAGLPDDAPFWARELAQSYMSGAASVFLLHGNLHDLVRVDDRRFVSLEDYLATQIFGRRDAVISYDRGSGIDFIAPGDDQRRGLMKRDFDRTVTAIDSINGTSFANRRPRDAATVLEILDRYITHKMLERPGDGEQKSLAIVIRYVETIAPAVDVSSLTGELGSNLLRLLSWANDPAIRNADITLCLLAENLADANRRLVENPFIAKLEVPLPDEQTRRAYAEHLLPAKAVDLDPVLLGRESNGLSLVGLAQAMARATVASTSSDDALKRAKKELIEKQCFGLVELVEPAHDLSSVVATPAVKQRLEEDARLFRDGNLDALPMGYLVCGPVGTGKTFTATCFAGSVGVPAILFKNLRDKWVGSSEGNMQKVLSVVRALGPVVVIVDEADAALGNRSGGGGDGGTSGRMFAMISAQMSDTRYRGRILWMLLTCRPDLLPVDLKRQGRAEVHLPLFPPATDAERQSMLVAMAAKNRITLDSASLPSLPPGLSGADIESLLVQARRRATLDGCDNPQPRHLLETLDRFVSPSYGAEKELQELVAIRECTDTGFLPTELSKRLHEPGGADEIDRQIRELTQLLYR